MLLVNGTPLAVREPAGTDEVFVVETSLAPLVPAEFVVVRIAQLAGQAQA